jgi:hypothetical protein
MSMVGLPTVSSAKASVKDAGPLGKAIAGSNFRQTVALSDFASQGVVVLSFQTHISMLRRVSPQPQPPSSKFCWSGPRPWW